MIYFANHTAGGSGKLVIGSFGQTGEASSQTFDWLGQFASECLNRVKVPVTIVKDAWASPKGDYSALGHVLRQGRNGKPGLTFMVCVDGSKVSKQAFDFAAGCLRRDDILYAFYGVLPVPSPIHPLPSLPPHSPHTAPTQTLPPNPIHPLPTSPCLFSSQARYPILGHAPY